MENSYSRSRMVFPGRLEESGLGHNGKGRWFRVFAVCVDLETGKIEHDIKVFDVANPQTEYNNLNTHATPTPIIEEGRIYVHFGSYGTACLDTKTGKKLWKRRDLNCDHRVRAASCPIIDGGLLFLTYDGVDQQFVAALEKKTGETRWLTKRTYKSGLVPTKDKPNDNRKSYATPTIIEHDGKKQLLARPQRQLIPTIR